MCMLRISERNEAEVCRLADVGFGFAINSLERIGCVLLQMLDGSQGPGGGSVMPRVNRLGPLVEGLRKRI